MADALRMLIVNTEHPTSNIERPGEGTRGEVESRKLNWRGKGCKRKLTGKSGRREEEWQKAELAAKATPMRPQSHLKAY
jgi:hypothetical protein